MKKSKFKYPDGGSLTLTTGTPEYQEYLKKQKQHEEYKAKHDNLISQGYANQISTNQAETDRLNKQFGITPSGWYRYDTPETSGETNFNGYIYNTDGGGAGNTGTRYTYAPYYDSPGEATIIKSETDMAAEKKKAENEALLKQYQGEVHEVVYNPQTNQNEVVKKQIPVGTDITDLVGSGKYFPYDTTTVPQYAGGGKLGSYIGDGLKLYGDYGLSMIGLDNVINDDMYKNKGFADASRVAEKFGSYAGKIAGNIIAPGIGGQVVGMAQNALGTIQPEDTYRQHLDQINSLGEQGQLGKFQNGAYSTSNLVNPAMAITTGVGELGTAFSGQGLEGMQNQLSNFKLPIFPVGGEMNLPVTYGNVVIDADPTNPPIEFNSPFYATPDDLKAMEYRMGVTPGNKPTNQQLNYIQNNMLPVHQYLDKKSMTVQIDPNGANKEANQQKFYEEQNRIFSEREALKNRGVVPTYPGGGKFVEYNGPTHAGGGVPIDQNGMPNSQMKAAEVEGGETMHDDGIDKYIFSDRLVIDPKSKITFADASKKINNKYKGTLDKIQKESRDAELNRLKQQQEEFKSTIAGTQNNQQVQTSMFPDGGVVGSSGLQLIPEDKNLGYDFELNPNFNNNPQINPLNYNPNIGLTIEGQAKDYYLKNGSFPTKISGAVQNELYKKFPGGGFIPYSPELLDEMQYGNINRIQTTPVSNIVNPSSNIDYSKFNNPYNPNYIDVTESNPSFNEVHGDLNTIYDESGNPTTIRSKRLQQIINDSNKTTSAQEGELPQDTISPWEYAASNIGNVYDLFQASKPAKVNNFGRVKLDRISLDPQRRELEKQANLAKDINRENVRSIATSSGQALTNQVIGNALANSTLGSGLSESFMSELNANNQIGNREKLTNFQVKQNEILADQQDKAMRQSTTSQALHGIGMNTQGYIKDIKSAKVGNKNNEMWFNAIKDSGQYVSLGTDANGNMVFKSKISGEIITKQI